jgi:hypothetical protein
MLETVPSVTSATENCRRRKPAGPQPGEPTRQRRTRLLARKSRELARARSPSGRAPCTIGANGHIGERGSRVTFRVFFRFTKVGDAIRHRDEQNPAPERLDLGEVWGRRFPCECRNDGRRLPIANRVQRSGFAPGLNGADRSSGRSELGNQSRRKRIRPKYPGRKSDESSSQREDLTMADDIVS